MEDYSNSLRPVEDTDKALNVSLQITLSQIKDMVRIGENQLFLITQHRTTDKTWNTYDTNYSYKNFFRWVSMFIPLVKTSHVYLNKYWNLWKPPEPHESEMITVFEVLELCSRTAVLTFTFNFRMF